MSEMRCFCLSVQVKDKVSLLEFLSQNFKSYGAKLQFITNRSQEGAQFCKGFGGIGGNVSDCCVCVMRSCVHAC